MVIIFEHDKNTYSGSGWIENIATLMPIIKSGAEAAAPIAQTAKTIKETINLKPNPNTLFANTQAILKQRDGKDDIFAKIRANIEKKKSGSGFVKVDSI